MTEQNHKEGSAIRRVRDARRTISAELDRQIAFTDGTDSLTESRIGFIDRIVYRLYGLTDEEVAVVEGNE